MLKRLTARQSKVWLLYCHFPLSQNLLREVCCYLSSSQFLPTIHKNRMQLYDLDSKQWSIVTLSVNLGPACVYCLYPSEKLLCIDPSAHLTYELNLRTGAFIFSGSLPQSLKHLPSLILADRYIYSFGGIDSKKAFKYDLYTQTWQEMRDMHYEKCAFTSCLYRGEIYLCSVTKSYPFEAFNPGTETYRDMVTVYHNAFFGSVTFLVKDMFYIVTYDGWLLKWLPGNDNLTSKCRISLQSNPHNAFTNLSTVHTGYSVYWTNHFDGAVVKFDIDTCCLDIVARF